MKLIKTVKLTAPSHWASYLINGDASGFEGGEQAQADAWIKAEGMGSPIDVADDEEFRSSHDAWAHCPLAGDCATYTFPVYQMRILFRVARATAHAPSEVTAILPDVPANPGRVTCYAHVGQHGEADLGWYKLKTRAAKPEEYAPLLRELTGIYSGCTLAIRKRLA